MTLSVITSSRNAIVRSAVVSVLLAALVASCGGDTPNGPSPVPPNPTPTIASISPATGTTAGGTEVSLTGTNFAGGATVTIGGVSTTNVRVLGTTNILAVTGAHASGAVDVVVTVGTQSGTLAGGFTYAVPPPNTLPTIVSLVVQGTRPNEPANFADLNEEIAVTATVRDAETPVAQLLYEWTSDAGTFTGTGAAVRWKAPSGWTTPAEVKINLKVSEVIQAVAGAEEVPTAITQSVMASTTVRLHDSAQEVGDLSVLFLKDFSNSALSPEYVVRNFWDGCPGKASELSDVQKNRANYVITSFQIDPPKSVSVNFQGTCAFRSRKGDACAATPVEWHSTDKSTGKTETAIGTDHTSAVYRNSRWWLCDSDFEGKVTNPFAPIPFIR